MVDIIGPLILAAAACGLFALMVYSLAREAIWVVRENRKLKRAQRFIDPLPDVLRVTPEQARELERWPVLDKTNRR